MWIDGGARRESGARVLCPPPGPPPASFLRLLGALSDGDPSGALAIGPTELADGEVHVWQARLDAWPQQLPVRLAREESDRAARLPSVRLRERFVLSRVLLRAVLASYLGVAPEAVAFDYGEQGKPHLRSPRRT